MDTLEQQVAGMMDDEDRIVAEMLGEVVAEQKKEAPAPKPAATIEVIQPQKPTKLLVSIPPDAPDQLTVTRVEVLEDGNFRILEAQRAPTPQERALILHGKKEVLSAPQPVGDVPATTTPATTGRPWWQYAIVAAAVAGGGYWAVNKYVMPQVKRNALEEALEEDEDEELEEEE